MTIYLVFYLCWSSSYLIFKSFFVRLTCGDGEPLQETIESTCTPLGWTDVAFPGKMDCTVYTSFHVTQFSEWHVRFTTVLYKALPNPSFSFEN